MSVETASACLARYGRQQDILFFDRSSATVELAAQALHTEGCRIAKTLSFLTKEGPILVVTAGDARIDNARYKARFGQRGARCSRPTKWWSGPPTRWAASMPFWRARECDGVSG